jgi:hypothetical protein
MAVALGKAYEAAVAGRLTALGCALSPAVRGGPMDQCVDLAGRWHFSAPFSSRPPWPSDAISFGFSSTHGSPSFSVGVVVQCKATRGAAGVSALREFMHALSARFPVDTLGVYACTGGFSLRSLRREREWASRDVLLLHTTPCGGVLDLLQLRRMGGRENLPLSFFTLARPTPTGSGSSSSSFEQGQPGGQPFYSPQR